MPRCPSRTEPGTSCPPSSISRSRWSSRTPSSSRRCAPEKPPTRLASEVSTWCGCSRRSMPRSDRAAWYPSTAPCRWSRCPPSTARRCEQMAVTHDVAFLDLAATHAERSDDYLSAIRDVLRHGGFVAGPEVSAFEREFAAYCEVP